MRNLVALAAILSLSFSSLAYAHAHVESSIPASGAHVAAPQEVKITFSEKLRSQESYIKIFDEGKKQVNDTKLIASNDDETLSAPVPELKPGKYTVKWKAVCLCNDHHATSGSYTFSVE